MDLPDTVKFEVVKHVTRKLTEYWSAKQTLGPAKLMLRDLITIDGVRAIFEDGWGLIRASNTQPALVLRFEATSSAQLNDIRTFVEQELADTKRVLGW